MMEIKIFGPGCPKCKVTESQVKRAVEQLGMIIQITKVEDIEEIMSYNIMSTPALIINGKMKSVGRVPSMEDIKRFIIEEKEMTGNYTLNTLSNAVLNNVFSISGGYRTYVPVAKIAKK